MSFSPARIRVGEWLLGLCSLALLVILFAAPWYGYPAAYSHAAAQLHAAYQFSGWQSLPVLRFLILVLCLWGFLAFYLQGRCRAPALPVCAIVTMTPLALVVLVLTWVRVIVDQPHVHLLSDRLWAFVALAMTFGILGGCYASLRQDHAPAPGRGVPIERLSVQPAEAVPPQGST